MIITLTRDVQQPLPAQCTLGVLAVNGRGVFQTIELPWVPSTDGPCGEPGKSCICTGTYRMESRTTEARGKHWQLSNPALGVYRFPASVPPGKYGRSLILIHAANWAHELRGCVAPGKTRLKQDGEWMVKDSRAAMNEMQLLLSGSFELQLVVT